MDSVVESKIAPLPSEDSVPTETVINTNKDSPESRESGGEDQKTLTERAKTAVESKESTNEKVSELDLSSTENSNDASKVLLEESEKESSKDAKDTKDTEQETKSLGCTTDPAGENQSKVEILEDQDNQLAIENTDVEDESAIEQVVKPVDEKCEHDVDGEETQLNNGDNETKPETTREIQDTDSLKDGKEEENATGDQAGAPAQAEEPCPPEQSKPDESTDATQPSQSSSIPAKVGDATPPTPPPSTKNEEPITSPATTSVKDLMKRFQASSKETTKEHKSAAAPARTWNSKVVLTMEQEAQRKLRAEQEADRAARKAAMDNMTKAKGVYVETKEQEMARLLREARLADKKAKHDAALAASTFKGATSSIYEESARKDKESREQQEQAKEEAFKASKEKAGYVGTFREVQLRKQREDMEQQRKAREEAAKSQAQFKGVQGNFFLDQIRKEKEQRELERKAREESAKLSSKFKGAVGSFQDEQLRLQRELKEKERKANAEALESQAKFKPVAGSMYDEALRKDKELREQEKVARDEALKSQATFKGVVGGSVVDENHRKLREMREADRKASITSKEIQSRYNNASRAAEVPETSPKVSDGEVQPVETGEDAVSVAAVMAPSPSETEEEVDNGDKEHNGNPTDTLSTTQEDSTGAAAEDTVRSGVENVSLNPPSSSETEQEADNGNGESKPNSVDTPTTNQEETSGDVTEDVVSREVEGEEALNAPSTSETEQEADGESNEHETASADVSNAPLEDSLHDESV